jgi:uncharacterized protein (TIGR02611 family)
VFTKLVKAWELLMSALPHPVRWLTTMVVGFLVVLIGLIMLPLPGPGTLIILLGLTILSVELEWARQSVKAGEQWMERLVFFLKKRFNRRGI